MIYDRTELSTAAAVRRSIDVTVASLVKHQSKFRLFSLPTFDPEHINTAPLPPVLVVVG